MGNIFIAMWFLHYCSQSHYMLSETNISDAKHITSFFNQIITNEENTIYMV